MKNLFCILLLAVMLVLVIAQYACADEEKAERTRSLSHEKENHFGSDGNHAVFDDSSECRSGRSSGTTDTIESQYGACMRAQQQFWVDRKLTAEEYAAEMDREWAAVIHGASDKDIWIEEFDDE